MGNIKQINNENRTYYFFNDMIKNFDLSLLKIDKKSYKELAFTTLDTLQLKRN